MSTKAPNLALAVLAAAVFAAVAAVLVVLPTSPAQAHLNDSGIDSADSNERMHFRNYTKYDDEVAHAAYWWNDLDTRWDYRGVRVTQVALDYSGVDLDVSDYSNCDSLTNGRWVGRSSSIDDIYFNRCRLDSDTSFDRKSTATHEFGHAHELAHSTESSNDYYRENSIMYFCSQCTNYNTPRPHDDDYFDKWIN